jgi:hypothetical protein
MRDERGNRDEETGTQLDLTCHHFRLGRGQTTDRRSCRAEDPHRAESLAKAGTNAWRDRPEPRCAVSPPFVGGDAAA